MAKTPAKKASTELAAAEMFENMPTGMETTTADDMLVPRLGILQALSPQLKKSDPLFIPGASQGEFVDTGTNEVFGEELHVLPVYYARIYLEWAPRESGKGLVANHGTDASVLAQTTRDDRNRQVLPNGNYVVETATWFVLNLTAGGRPSFIPMSSTQLKHSRRWMTLAKNEKLQRDDGTEFTPPLYYRSYKATSVPESNNHGEWFSWRFTPDQTVLELDPHLGLLKRASEFCKDAAEGLVKGDMSQDIESEVTNDPAAANAAQM